MKKKMLWSQLGISRFAIRHSPQHGVVTLFGYGIQARVDRGHLIVEDGIGAARRHVRFPRMGHGIRTLVLIGSDGMVSLAALRWLADQNAAFIMLNRDGSVLATTGPVRSSDAKLRRARTRTSLGSSIAHHARIDWPEAGRTGTSCPGQNIGDAFNINTIDPATGTITFDPGEGGVSVMAPLPKLAVRSI